MTWNEMRFPALPHVGYPYRPTVRPTRGTHVGCPPRPLVSPPGSPGGLPKRAPRGRPSGIHIGCPFRAHFVLGVPRQKPRCPSRPTAGPTRGVYVGRPSRPSVGPTREARWAAQVGPTWVRVAKPTWGPLEARPH